MFLRTCVYLHFAYAQQFQLPNKAGTKITLFNIKENTAIQLFYATHWRKEKQVAAWFCDDDLIISTRELCNHGDVFPWAKGRNNEAGSRWTGFLLKEEEDRWIEKRGKTEHTLLSSGCTPHICKEEAACLPGQQKELDLYTSVKTTQVVSRYGFVILNMSIMIVWLFIIMK